MTEQPRGTVSFLLSDIEGSTRLLQALGGERYRAVFDRHRSLLRNAFARHGGWEAGSRGDGFFVAFPSARAAVAAATAAQRALVDDESQVRVRMAVNTGAALLDPPDYVGLEVHKAARLMNAAHGGQVLISHSTRVALDGELPDGVVLRDLGEHWLPDIGAPEPLHQLVIAGLPNEFPLPRTHRGPAAPLPAQPTRFLGREGELNQIAAMLARDDVRLLTLTGPGGTGKTRLALVAAAQRAGSDPGGVHFVALAGLGDPDLIGTTLATTLGLSEEPGAQPWELVSAFLARRDTLLVLDNLEHLLDGVEPLGALLSACPRLTILATSRARLRLAAEREFGVPPLIETEAIELFVDRADAVSHGFHADAHVARICRALDHLPLAIELAAARVDGFTSAEIAARLDERLRLLTDGPRDAPARQRTLRATLDWSFALLQKDAQRALGRLAVFRGGFTLEAAEAVCSAGAITLQVLIDNNLVRGAGDRFEMLELIREYALEHCADADVIGARHAEYFVELVERAEPELRSARRDRYWLARLSGERDNVRAALRRLIDLPDGPHAHRLVAALWAYWHDVGPVSEAAEWFARVIPLPAPDRLRARTLAHGAVAAGFRGEHVLVAQRAGEALELARRGDDLPTTVIALQLVGSRLKKSGQPERGIVLVREALDLARQTGDPWLIGITLVTTLSGDHITDLDEAASLADEAGRLRNLNVVGRAMVEFARARISLRRGDLDDAIAMYRSSIALAREAGSDKALGGLTNLAFLLLRRGELIEARTLMTESMGLKIDTGSPGDVAAQVADFSVLCAAEGDLRRAAILRGAVEIYRETVGEVPDLDFWDGSFDGYLEEARAMAGEAVWGAAFAEGRRLAMDDAVALALNAGISATVGTA